MKKSFKLTAPNKAPARQVDSVKHEINKYIARERRKTVAKNADFWDFDCKFGDDAANAEKIELTEINKCIDKTVAEEKEAFYIEILAKPGHKTKTK
ncbi:MAG: hypothetical protein H7177_14350 [Rhizobacter sp.]|nr:hypothetical protein [Bacteriovorax sp.]